jgi:hypothetical protein
MLVHHAESSIVTSNRDRLAALQSFLSPAVRNAFCEGDAPALHVQLSALAHRHPSDALVAELRRSLPSRVGRPPRERNAIWTAIEDALAPERCLAESLDASCVAPAGLDRWLMPLRGAFGLTEPAVLREPDGSIIGWHIGGCRNPA